jgi:hypothetical protein
VPRRSLAASACISPRDTVLEVTPDLLDQSVRPGSRHALRAYDAVQLAMAPEVNRSHQADGFAPITLISAD